MFYVFENGRILQDPLKPEIYEKGFYIEVEVLPELPLRAGMRCYLFADIKEGLVKVASEPHATAELPNDNHLQEIPPKPYQPTEGELLIMKSQAAMYEELQESKLSQMKANADIYEAILSNGGTI